MKVVVYGDKVSNDYQKKMDSFKTGDELDEINGGKAAQVQLEIKGLKEAQEKIVSEGLISKFTPIITHLAKKLENIKTIVLKKALVLSQGLRKTAQKTDFPSLIVARCSMFQ